MQEGHFNKLNTQMEIIKSYYVSTIDNLIYSNFLIYFLNELNMITLFYNHS
jgi:hypothetical protein